MNPFTAHKAFSRYWWQEDKQSSMTGEQAYKEDCRRRPTYHDGSKRPSCDQLHKDAKESWNKNPTPRNWD